MPLPRSNAFLLLAVMAWSFGGSEIYRRGVFAVEGTLVSSTTTCVQPANNRCASEYVVLSSDGVRTSYVAGPTDASLPRDLPVGTVISKRRWSIDYFLNGQRVDDFPVMFYAVVMAFGVLCLCLWVMRFSLGRSPRNS
jgi:hypothetical protein